MTKALAGISEWEPSSLSNNPALISWLLFGVFVLITFQLSIVITRAIMLLILIYMAFAHLRYTELLGLAAPLLLQDALAGTNFSSLGTKIFVGASLFHHR